MSMPVFARNVDLLVASGRTLLLRDPAVTLGHSQSEFDSAALVSQEQAQVIETLAIIFATLSTIASVCGVYWFVVMRRNFRRDLILLLIVGNL
jgi:G protein-coupled receptor GPR1